MIRCRSTASGSVVEDCPAGTEIRHELEKGIDMLNYGLTSMVQMGDSEVRGEDRHGIAKDQVVVSVEDSPLAFGEAIQAEEASPFVYIFSPYVGQAAPDSSRILLKAYRKSSALDIPLLDVFK